MEHLAQVIRIDEEKCVNCHACISACPIKLCNDGSGDHVSVNADMCLACGRCIDACTHNAREYVDDLNEFLAALEAGEPVVAIVAPSVAANFPGNYLHLNGWLKHLGVAAVFDVSFGAELCVRSIVEAVRTGKPTIYISQACPAIVSYIEIFEPELLPYLLPYDSPMVHTMKMIRDHFPQYADHRVAVLSPCLAKKREFIAAGFGDFNVGYQSLADYLFSHDIVLHDWPEVDFDSPMPERGVLFSKPGGMMRTLERWLPGVSANTRRIEGNPHVYDYLQQLPEIIEQRGSELLVVDCLNCSKGCNGGPLTLVKDKALDQIESWIEHRNQRLAEHHGIARMEEPAYVKALADQVNRFWEATAYVRRFPDLTENNSIRHPSEAEKWSIYHRMHKYTEEHLYNCSSCGYGCCEDMATAIHNDLNRPENCHHYLLREREDSLARIRASQERLHRILSTTAEAFMQIDLDCIIQEVNPSTLTLLNASECELLGRSVMEFVDHANAEIMRHHLRLRRSNQATSYELVFSPPGVPPRTCLIHGTPLYDEDGALKGSFALITDITKRKDVERALQRANEELEDRVARRTRDLEHANRTKDEFLANMSHEIRTPLSAIMGFSEIILQTEETDQVHELAQTILHQSEVLRSLINDLLDLSKIEAGRIELETQPFSLHELLNQVVANANVSLKSDDLELRLIVDGKLPATVIGDQLRLNQILTNLTSNAVKFTDRGSVTVGTELVRETADQMHVRFSVEDTGIGIPPEKQGLVFDAFTQADASTTRRYGGSGLGLAITRQLVALMGGEITLTSNVGVGSLFSFEIPLGRTREMLAARPASKRHTPSPPQAAHILVAEDYPTNQALIGHILFQAGYTFDVVENGVEAVNAARKTAYDLILMDVHMPQMDGLEATRAIRENSMCENAPILAITANAKDSARAACMQAGMNGVVTKPFGSSELLHAIANRSTVEVPPAPTSATQTAAASDDNAPAAPLDMNYLHEEFGDRSLIAEMTVDFLNILEEQMVQMTDAAERKDPEVLRKEAHRIKSGAGGLGAREVQRIATELEQKAKDGDIDTAVSLLPELNNSISQLQVFVQSTLTN